MQILPNPTPTSFKITDQYVWFPNLYTLPAHISYDVTCGSEQDEFLPCFSFTKAEWNSPECDALCWYLSPHRNDFTFRTELFRKFPSVKRVGAPFCPTVGTKFKVSCSITPTSATYSVNGKPYAIATYNEKDIPNEGYFGFASYNPENITVENVQVGAKQVIEPLGKTDERLSINMLTTMLDLLGALFSGEKSKLTKVTKAEAETMIKNAIIGYRETPNINKLSKNQVHAAIDKVYNEVHSEVKSFFDEEIAEESLMAASQAAMAVGSIFSFFPLVSIICDGTALVTMATAVGLEIDIQKKGPKIIADANGLKKKVDKQVALKPLKKWNDARDAELLTMGRLMTGAGMKVRGSSFIHALIFVIDQKNLRKLTDDQLFDKIKELCISVNKLSAEVPKLGNKLAELISNEDPKAIKAELKKLAEKSTNALQWVGIIGGPLILGIKLAFNSYKNFKLVRETWNAVEGEELPEGMESKWFKTMGTVDKVQAGVFAVAGIFFASIEIWQAVKTTKEKSKALKTIDDNRDSIKSFYDTVMSHVH